MDGFTHTPMYSSQENGTYLLTIRSIDSKNEVFALFRYLLSDLGYDPISKVMGVESITIKT
ncbi:MAG: hypothetical protein M0Q12_04245 [Synergistaceae bacterium]|jgi:hypothetical protein|nr:hypothetical protein [Synergistaceae bacterium]